MATVARDECIVDLDDFLVRIMVRGEFFFMCVDTLYGRSGVEGFSKLS